MCAKHFCFVSCLIIHLAATDRYDENQPDLFDSLIKAVLAKHGLQKSSQVELTYKYKGRTQAIEDSDSMDCYLAAVEDERDFITVDVQVIEEENDFLLVPKTISSSPPAESASGGNAPFAVPAVAAAPPRQTSPSISRQTFGAPHQAPLPAPRSAFEAQHQPPSPTSRSAFKAPQHELSPAKAYPVRATNCVCVGAARTWILHARDL